MEPFSLTLSIFNPFKGVTSSLVLTDGTEENELKGGAKKIDVSGLEDFEKMETSLVLDVPDPSAVRVFPQDTISSMREKIYIATGIPPFRQHITYTIDGAKYATYFISVTDESIRVNIEKDFTEGSGDRLDKYPLSRTMINNREDIEVFTYEIISSLRSPSGDVSLITVTDLFDVADPRDKSVLSLVNDDHHRDFFYYGVLLRYFPLLPYDGFLHVYQSNGHMGSLYPLLQPEFKALKNRLKQEGELLSSCLREVPEALKFTGAKALKTPFYLTRIVVDISFPYINIRNLFDLLVLDENYVYCVARIVSNGISFIVEKKHRILFREDISRPPLQGISALLRTPGGISLLINKNTCTVELNFREEEKMGYEGALERIDKVVRPLIEFLKQKRLSLLMEGDVPEELSISVFSSDMVVVYPLTIDTSVFNGFTSYLKPYVSAGILELKATKPGEHTLTLIKGSSLSVPIDTVNPAKNQYEQYTNLEYKARLDSITFRQVNMVQRASDVAMYLPNFTRAEYEGISPILLSMFHSYVRSTGKKGFESSKIQKVKRLQEIDPELFNFKKHDPSVPVYSVRCQASRQPFLYREDELEGLAPKVKEALVPFRNFTDASTVYYHCPNKKYPNLVFKPKVHPLKYCVPCCKKLDVSSSSAITSLCLKKFKLTEEELEEALGTVKKVSHVLTYSKIIPPGRASAIPPLMGKWIGKSRDQHVLSGAEQSLPGVPEAGIFFSYCFCLGIGPDELVRDLLQNIEDKIFFIDTSEIDKVGSLDEFKDMMISSFTMASPAISLEIDWTSILMSLVKITYGFDTIRVIDSGFKLSLDLPRSSSVALRGGITTKGYIVVVEHENGTYPVSYEGSGILPETNVLVMEIKKRISLSSEARSSQISLALLSEFLSKDTSYSLSEILIGRRHLAYAAVLLRGKDKILVPVTYAEIIPEKYGEQGEVKLRKEPLAKLEGFPRDAVLQFIGDYSAVTKSKLLVNYSLVYDGKAIAMAYVAPGMTRKYSSIFYHEPSSLQEGVRYLPVPYNLTEVNTAISGNLVSKFGDIDHYLYENYAYRLFVQEFAMVVRQNGDASIRKKVMTVVSKPRVSKKLLRTVLEKYPRDYKYLEGMLSRHGSSSMPGIVRFATFDFDRVLMSDLLLLSLDERKRKVRSLMEDRVSFTTEPISMSNTYVSCIETDQPQCEDGKLLLWKSDFEYFVSLLSEDISLVHRYNVISMYSAGTVFPLVFQTHPHEKMTVEVTDR